MSFSIQRETSDGTLSTIDLAIEYIDQADISVFVDDILIEMTGGVTPYTWEWVTPSKIKITPNVPNGLVTMIRRGTPNDTMYHNFNAGAVFKDETMDENFLQLLYLVQEAKEGSGATDFYADLDMHGYIIRNHGPALVDSDVVTLGQYRNDALGAMANRVLAESARDTVVAAKDLAVTSASNAATSENNAAASELAAAGSASAAEVDRILAGTSAASAVAAFDSFDDRYLGPKNSDPTLDNDGNTLLEGALYWNTVVKEMRVYNGTAWSVAYLPVAAYVTEADLAVELANKVTTTDLTNATDPAKGAGMVGFKQAGAGAVARTVMDKAREFVSVKDFGAVGDGVADDTAALTVAGDTAFMPEGEYVTTSITKEYNSRKSGPGFLSSAGTLFNNGENARISAHGNPLTNTLRQNYAIEGAPVSRSTVLAVTPVSMPSGTYTALNMTRVQEGAAVFFPGVSTSLIFATSRTKVLAISGSVSFAASTGGGVRAVVLRKNGAVYGQINVAPCGGGAASSVTFNFAPTTIPGDYFELAAYHDAGAALYVSSGEVLVSIASEAPYKLGGKRLLIYQGSWAAQEALYGSYEALLAAVAQYDVLALSHIETFGALPYPMMPNPNGIMDVGYKHLKRLIHDYKFLRPDGLVFGYVSAAIDAPTWDGGGNPTTNTWTSATYPNFQWWCNLWLKDRHLPIDGFFLDHFNSAFMSAIARDNVAAIVKRVFGKKMMVNITAASSAAVRWASECTMLGYGDYMCLEGFYKDNGADSFAGTNAAIAELAFNDARGLLFAVVNEEGAGTTINNGSVNNLNGVSLFNSFYKLGWCYQYGRVTYDTIGTPGI